MEFSNSLKPSDHSKTAAKAYRQLCRDTIDVTPSAVTPSTPGVPQLAAGIQATPDVKLAVVGSRR